MSSQKTNSSRAAAKAPPISGTSLYRVISVTPFESFHEYHVGRRYVQNMFTAHDLERADKIEREEEGGMLGKIRSCSLEIALMTQGRENLIAGLQKSEKKAGEKLRKANEVTKLEVEKVKEQLGSAMAEERKALQDEVARWKANYDKADRFHTEACRLRDEYKQKVAAARTALKEGQKQWQLTENELRESLRKAEENLKKAEEKAKAAREAGVQEFKASEEY